MKINKDHSFKVLLAFSCAFFLSTIVGIFNIYDPNYSLQQPFEPNLWTDWLSVFSFLILVVYTTYLAITIKDKWAKLFWGIITVYYGSAIIEEVLTFYIGSMPVFIDVIEVFSMFVISIAFLIIYKKQRYRLFTTN